MDIGSFRSKNGNCKHWETKWSHEPAGSWETMNRKIVT